MFSVDRSIEGLCIDSDMEKWPLGRMEVDQSATRWGQRDALGGYCANSGINDGLQVEGSRNGRIEDMKYFGKFSSNSRLFSFSVTVYLCLKLLFSSSLQIENYCEMFQQHEKLNIMVNTHVPNHCTCC